MTTDHESDTVMAVHSIDSVHAVLGSTCSIDQYIQYIQYSSVLGSGFSTFSILQYWAVGSVDSAHAVLISTFSTDQKLGKWDDSAEQYRDADARLR